MIVTVHRVDDKEVSRKMKKIKVLSAILMCSWAANFAMAQATPKMVVEKKIVDLGKVPEGTQHKIVFTIKNEGEAPLIIEDAHPSCGCTVADFDAEIAPGKTGEVRATLDTSHFKGAISKAIFVASNDPVKPSVALAIRANVIPFIAVYPGAVMRFNVLEKEGASKTVVVAGSERCNKFKLTGASSKSKDLKVTYRELEESEYIEDGGKPQYEVTVEISKDAEARSLNEKVKLSTDRKEYPEITLHVMGIIRSLLRVSPALVQFGAVEVRAKPERNVVIVNNKPGEDVHLLKATIDDPSFKVEMKTEKDGKRYLIVISIAPDATTGLKDTVLKITTDDPDKPLIKVPVRAALR